MSTGLQAICITQVCIIFKLPGHLGHYPHPLAYVEWFMVLHQHEPISRHPLHAQPSVQCLSNQH